MKIKYIIIVSIMLAILTIGAASASDEMLSDDGNLTASPEDTIVESSVDETELNTNDAEDVAGDDAELITDYDYSVEVQDEYLIGSNVYAYGSVPKDASGTVKMTVDDEYEVESEIYDSGFYLSLDSSDLTVGLHNCKISYSGDDRYAGFEYQKEFRMGNVAVNMPDEIVKEDFEKCVIGVNWGVTGQITINIDNEKYVNGSIAELTTSFDEDIYHIPLDLDYLPFGLHSYEIITTIDGEGTVTRTGSFNMTYLLDSTNDFDSVPYGKDFNFMVYTPRDAKSNISVIFNGDSFEYKLTGSETIIPLTNLVFGANNITLTYVDDKYPLKTVKYVLYVKGVIEIPYGVFYYDSDETISLTLPEGASGNIAIYNRITDWNTGETQEELVGVAQVINGHASYPIKNLGLGKYELLVKYENGTYDVDDVASYITIFPKVTYTKGVQVGQESNFTMKFPDGADGNLTISIFECDEWGYNIDENDDKIELFKGQVTSDEIIINLNTSKKAYYKILFDYDDGNIKLDNKYSEFAVKVYDIDREWQLDVDFPSEILQGDFVYLKMDYPKGADGNVDLYVDGNIIYSISGFDSDGKNIEFYADFSIGSHDWEIKYYGDIYYANSSQSGTFEINWVNVPDVLEIGGITSMDVHIDGCTGSVKLKIDGEDYGEQTLEDYQATFDLSNLNQGMHTYEITYANMSKSGSFNMSYAINVNVGDCEDLIEFSKSNHVEVVLPEDATGSVTISFNEDTYSSDVNDGVALFDIPLNWGENTLTIRFSGDDKYEARQIQKTFTIEETRVSINKVDGVFANASLYLPSDADGNLSISIWGVTSISIPLVNGEAVINREDLPIGCYGFDIDYDGTDYQVYSRYVYVSIEPDMNITREINEGDDCIIDIDLPDSSSGLDIYVDGELNKTVYFVDGKLHTTIPNLSLGQHTITFTYSGGIIKILSKDLMKTCMNIIRSPMLLKLKKS